MDWLSEFLNSGWGPTVTSIAVTLITIQAGRILENARAQNEMAAASKSQAEEAEIIKKASLDLIAPLNEEIIELRKQVKELKMIVAKLKKQLIDAGIEPTNGYH